MALADQARLRLAPHFAMEIHLHLSAAYPHEPWVEHFDWLEPLFNERLHDRGRPHARARPARARLLDERAGAALDQGARGVRQARVTHLPTLDDGIAGVAFVEAACTPSRVG